VSRTLVALTSGVCSDRRGPRRGHRVERPLLDCRDVSEGVVAVSPTCRSASMGPRVQPPSAPLGNRQATRQSNS